MGTITLYRPVGQKEWDLIIASGYRRFPPRLEWQPIFYPVMNQEYAEQIAAQWNTEDESGGYVGHVLSFEVAESYLQQFPVQNVGGVIHNELWVPAEQMDAFNNEIIGQITLIKTFYGSKYIEKNKMRNPN